MTATATTPVGSFDQGPHVRVELDGTCPNPASPKRDKVTGSVEIAFQGNGAVYVGTAGAHVNDANPGLEFKGRRFLGSVHLRRQEDGTWTTELRPHVSDRDNWSVEGPAKTYVTAIVEALTHEVEKAWTPELEKAGQRASLLRSLYHADREEAETRAAYEAAAWEQARVRKALAALDAS